ncbi:MAG: hypothetical protein ACPIOQ_68125, partial [Promethearchaeia archaeon]
PHRSRSLRCLCAPLTLARNKSVASPSVVPEACSAARLHILSNPLEYCMVEIYDPQRKWTEAAEQSAMNTDAAEQSTLNAEAEEQQENVRNKTEPPTEAARSPWSAVMLRKTASRSKASSPPTAPAPPRAYAADEHARMANQTTTHQ